MNDPYTYIEKDTLNAWGVQMTQLNYEAIDIINSIEEEVKELKEYWKGNAANGFCTNMDKLVKDGKNYHTKMKNVENMLKEVVITAENQ